MILEIIIISLVGWAVGLGIYTEKEKEYQAYYDEETGISYLIKNHRFKISKMIEAFNFQENVFFLFSFCYS